MKYFFLFLFCLNLTFSQNKNEDIKRRIVVIDPGHGGSDLGSLSKFQTFKEKEFNLRLAKIISEKLNKDIKVFFTREEDDKFKNSERVAMSNLVNANMFISIHIGSSEYENPEDLCQIIYNKRNNNSLKFVEIAQNEIKSIYRCEDVSVQQKSLDIFDKLNCFGMLIQIGNMFDDDSIEYLNTDIGIEQIANTFVSIIHKSIY